MTNKTYQIKRRRDPNLLRDISLVLARYARRCEVTFETALHFSLVELRHYADIHDLDFNEIDGNAMDGYSEERCYTAEEHAA